MKRQVFLIAAGLVLGSVIALQAAGPPPPPPCQGCPPPPCQGCPPPPPGSTPPPTPVPPPPGSPGGAPRPFLPPPMLQPGQLPPTPVAAPILPPAPEELQGQDRPCPTCPAPPAPFPCLLCPSAKPIGTPIAPLAHGKDLKPLPWWKKNEHLLKLEPADISAGPKGVATPMPTPMTSPLPQLLPNVTPVKP